MALFAALGKSVGDNITPIIFSFLDDSSVVPICGSDSRDIAAVNDLRHYFNWSDTVTRNFLKCIGIIKLELRAKTNTNRMVKLQ